MDRHDWAPVVVRWGLSLVFLWFGLNQLFNAQAFVGYLPGFSSSLPLAPTLVVMISGTMEIALGMLLLLGLFTRVVALLLGIHLLGIIITLGYNEIAVRDAGLLIALISVFLHGADELSADMRLWP
jgi:uncharacterized membrane protein YphA (DoxX/SURF4 family)